MCQPVWKVVAKGTHLPWQLPIIHTGTKLLHHQLCLATMGVMAEVCNLVSGLKVCLPEETGLRWKYTWRRERKEGVPPDWTTGVGDLRGGSILNLRSWNNFSLEWPKCEGKYQETKQKRSSESSTNDSNNDEEDINNCNYWKVLYYS